MEKKSDKVIRTVIIVLVGLTAAMNLLGGIGTICAAFFTKKYPPMWALYDYQWLYQLFVVVTTLVGIVGVWSTISLVKGGKRVYELAVAVVGVGTLVNLVHFLASMNLRGKGTPANVVFAINLVTLIALLLTKLPGIRERVDFTNPSGRVDGATASGLAAIVGGILCLTVGIWVAPSHTYNGENWALALQWPLALAGAVLVLGGLGSLYSVLRDVVREERLQEGTTAGKASR